MTWHKFPDEIPKHHQQIALQYYLSDKGFKNIFYSWGVFDAEDCVIDGIHDIIYFDVVFWRPFPKTNNYAGWSNLRKRKPSNNRNYLGCFRRKNEKHIFYCDRVAWYDEVGFWVTDLDFQKKWEDQLIESYFLEII